MAHTDTEHKVQGTAERYEDGKHWIGWVGTCTCGWETEARGTSTGAGASLLAHVGI